MKDRNGEELEDGDVVVVERGPAAGVVGAASAATVGGYLHVMPELFDPWRTVRLALVADVRKANDIERARWKRAARVREKAATDAWLDRSPTGGHRKGD